MLNRLSEAIKERTALLPNGDTMRISISGGIAWYPENGRDLATIKKYADFAMYQVKKTEKGKLQSLIRMFTKKNFVTVRFGVNFIVL